MTRVEELDIVVRYRPGKVIAGVPHLSLYATGETAQAAIAELEKKRAALIGDMAAADIPNEIIDAGDATHRKSVGGLSLGRFAARTAIVASILAIAAVFAGSILLDRIEVQFQQLTRVGGRNFWTQIENALDRAADPKNEMPEAKKKKLEADVRTLVSRWRPLIAPLFRDEPGATAPLTAKEPEPKN